jgi:hypothetical protein
MQDFGEETPDKNRLKDTNKRNRNDMRFNADAFGGQINANKW